MTIAGQITHTFVDGELDKIQFSRNGKVILDMLVDLRHENIDKGRKTVERELADILKPKDVVRYDKNIRGKRYSRFLLWTGPRTGFRNHP